MPSIILHWPNSKVTRPAPKVGEQEMWAKIYLAVVVLRLQSQALLVLMMIAHGPFRKQPGFDWSGLNGVEDKDYIDGILRMACGNLRWSRLNTFLRHSNLISAPLYLPTLIIILPTLDETHISLQSSVSLLGIAPLFLLLDCSAVRSRVSRSHRSELFCRARVSQMPLLIVFLHIHSKHHNP